MSRVRKKKTPRSFLRRSASSSVKVTCVKKGAENTGPNVLLVVLDLSEAGTRLVVSTTLDAGEDVIVTLEEPSCPSPLMRLGKVVWSFQLTRAHVVGILFNEPIGEEDIQKVTIQPCDDY